MRIARGNLNLHDTRSGEASRPYELVGCSEAGSDCDLRYRPRGRLTSDQCTQAHPLPRQRRPGLRSFPEHSGVSGWVYPRWSAVPSYGARLDVVWVSRALASVAQPSAAATTDHSMGIRVQECTNSTSLAALNRRRELDGVSENN